MERTPGSLEVLDQSSKTQDFELPRRSGVGLSRGESALAHHKIPGTNSLPVSQRDGKGQQCKECNLKSGGVAGQLGE